MEYQTIAFNVNAPVIKKIVAPLDSQYGVAVKVYKDGEAIDCTCQIDGKTLDKLQSGWMTTTLHTSPMPCQKKKDVIVRSGAEFETKFKLIVQEQDLGYIEQSRPGTTELYELQSVGTSISDQMNVVQAGAENLALWFKTDASSIDGKLLAAASYMNADDDTPYVTFYFESPTLSGGFLQATAPETSSWMPAGASTTYMKTWFQDEGYIEPEAALGNVLDWTVIDASKSLVAKVTWKH